MTPVPQSTVGILMTHNVGLFDAVRKHGNILDRIERRLMQKVTPGKYAVRGNITAMDTLAEAMLRKGSSAHYELYCPPGAARTLTQRLEEHWHIQRNGISIIPAHELTNRPKDNPLALLFSPNFGYADTFRIRDYMSSPIFPIINVSHGFSMPEGIYDTFVRVLLSNSYPCDSLICTSRASHTAMSRKLDGITETFNREFGTHIRYSGRVDQIPLCVDTELFRPLDKRACRKQFGLPNNAIILLYFGRISALKADLVPLLAVLALLMRKNKDRELYLVIAGTADDVYIDTLNKRIDEYGLRKNVRIIQNCPDSDRSAMYSMADIFVAPTESLQESFGLAPVEAMACGLPQVVSDWNGYRDTVVHGETGFLVPTYWMECDNDLLTTGMFLGWQYDHFCLGSSTVVDMKALEDSLQTMIERDTLRKDMSIQSRKRAELLYSYAAVVKQYEALALELSAIARNISKRAPSKTFDRPRYSKWFAGHASCFIDETWRVALSPLCGEPEVQAVMRDLSSRPKKPDDIQILDDAVVASGLSMLKKLETESSLAIGRLASDLSARFPYSRDHILRTIMWMSKYGMISIHEP